MGKYLSFLRTPGVARLILSAFPGRLAYGMVNLSIFFFVQHTSSSITIAGLATGTSTVTSSLTAGFRGSTIDRFGQTKPLSFFIPAWVLCVFILHQQTTVTGIVACCFFLGLCSPPINLSTRPLWRVIVKAEDLRTAYAIDTTILNTTAVIGPVIATRIAFSLSGPTALLVTATLMAFGGTLMISMPHSRQWKPEPREKAMHSLFTHRPFQILLIEGMIFGLAWGVLDIAIPAISTLHHRPQLAAPLLACLAGSSIVGGIIIGGRQSSITPLQGFKVSSACVALACLPLAFTLPGWSMAISLILVGLAIGFAQVYHWEVLEAVRPSGTATTAQAWLWTLEGSMMAVGTASGGYIVEHISAAVALGTVTLGILCSTAFIWLYASSRLQDANKPISPEQKIDALIDLENSTE